MRLKHIEELERQEAQIKQQQQMADRNPRNSRFIVPPHKQIWNSAKGYPDLFGGNPQGYPPQQGLTLVTGNTTPIMQLNHWNANPQ